MSCVVPLGFQHWIQLELEHSAAFLRGKVCTGCKGPHMRRDCPKEKGKFDKQRRINELRSQLSQLEDTLDIPLELSDELLSQGF